MALGSDEAPRARPGEVVAGAPPRTRCNQEVQLNGGRLIRAAAFCGAIVLAPVAVPAHAQVIEVRPDGAEAVYSGPMVFSADGRAPIAAAAAIRAEGIRATPTAAVSDAIQTAADRRQLSARLIEAVAWQESHLNQKAVSPKGALGVMQLRPATAAQMGVDPGDLRGNVDGGAAYLTRLLQQFDGDIVLTLAAYNAGPEAVRRYGGVPPYPETRAYVAAVLDRLADMAKARPEAR